jgi:hypothetical protein
LAPCRAELQTETLPAVDKRTKIEHKRNIVHGVMPMLRVFEDVAELMSLAALLALIAAVA